MPTHSRRSRRRPARRIITTSAAAFGLTAIALSIWAITSREPARIEIAEDSIGFESFEPFENEIGSGDLMQAGLSRPVYRYSVVPGGTYTTEELRAAIQNDPVVAAHYTGLDQSQLRVERVARDRYVHVSYRKGNEVFWTKSTVLLRQGETIITDGRTQVRARCGNCISEEPLLPTANDEPDSVEFDRLTEPIAAGPTSTPRAALAPPVSPLALGAPAAAPSLASGIVPPLAAGPLGGRVPPLASTPRNTGTSDPGDPAPPVNPPGPDTPPGPDDPPPPWNPPGDNPPPYGPEPPPGDEPPPLVPPDDYAPPDVPPPDGPPPYVPPGPPGDPVPVPEAGTLLLVGCGAAALLRRVSRRRSSKAS